MLSGKQLILLSRKKNYNDDILSKKLGITKNDIIIYEYGIKPIPEDLYKTWKALVLFPD